MRDAASKRSITIRGHRTSITIEDVIWKLLQPLACDRGITRARLLRDIDDNRNAKSLSSSIRVTVVSALAGGWLPQH